MQKGFFFLAAVNKINFFQFLGQHFLWINKMLISFHFIEKLIL